MKNRLVNFLTVASMLLVVQSVDASIQTFFNEFHYDNDGADANEFVEIAGAAGTDLTGWSVVFYNGNGGGVYGTHGLSGTIVDQGSGFGTVSFLWSGIQNGAPDGFALVDASSNVIEFLSYEGTLTAVGGAANGLTSTDVGVAESGSTLSTESLQRIGMGRCAEDFTWVGPSTASAGSINERQTLVNAVPEPSSAFCWAMLALGGVAFGNRRARR